MKRDCEEPPIGEDPPKAPRVGPSVDADTQTTGGGYGYPRTIAPLKVNAPPVPSSDVVLSPYAPSAALVPEAMITAAVAAMRDEEDHMDANGYAEAPTMHTDTPDEKPPPPAKEDTPPEMMTEVVMEEEAVVMMMGEEETRAPVTHVEPVPPPEEPPSIVDQTNRVHPKEPLEEPDANTFAPASDGRKTLSQADAIRILGAKPVVPASDADKPKPLWTVPGLDPHSLWKAIQRDPDRFARDVLKDLERAERTEPYLQVGDQWRREPWEVNPYEQIGPGFVVARDLPEPDASDVVDKLYTTMPEGWTDLPPEIHPGSLIAHTNPATDDVACLKCGKTDGEADFVLCDACPDDDVRGGHWRCLEMPGLPTGDWFCDRCVRDGKGTNGDAGPVSAGVDTDKQCKDKAVPNGMMAPIIPLHPYVPHAKPVVENRSPLKLGVDLEERPMWGCDCYTRVAIDAALACAAGYKGVDVDARRKRDRFFAKLLMPAVHTMGADGWDLALALDKLKAGDSPRDPYDASEPETTTDGASDQSPTSAFERDFETIKEGCDSILRAIREVDEAQLPTVPPPKPAKGSKTKLQEGGGAATFGIKGSKESRNAAAKAAGIKQPMQAFFIFSNEQRAILLESQPELRSNITAVGKMMGDRWKKMSADEKFPYAIKAEEAKLVYEEKAAAAEEEAHAAAKLREEEEMSQLAKERADAEAKKLEAAAALEREIAEAAEKGITLQICGYGKKPRKPNQSSLKSHKRRHFRMHPKGIGIVCVRPGGLPPGTYIQDYLGELYSPWRWYERQDAIKKREPNKELPDFFNITLERPAEDARGHDVLFVEAAHRCTFASRLSHSCAPNCQTVGVAVADQSGSSHEPLTKLSIAQYTTRHIAHGEELCWNYSCVTESEKEYRAAICLCSSTTCKGAFLDYAGSSAFTAVMNTRHNFLDRNALLLRACSEPLTDSDRTRLTAAGIKSCALTMPGERDPRTGGRVEAPAWLIKWAALTLEYVEMEKALLPAALTAKPLDGITYDAGFAAATAAGVVATRVSNLVVTLDKIKYVMRQPGQNRAPFLRPLSDEEIVRHLLGEEGVLPRAADTFAKKVGVKHGLTFFGGKGSRREAAGGEAKMPAGVGQKEGDVLRFILDALARYSKDSSMTPAAAAQTTEACSKKIRSLGETHFAMADCLLLYARTKHWCTPEQYNGFQSPPVQLVPLPKDKLQKKEAAVESISTQENGAAENDETVLPLTETPETETAPAPPDETAAGDKKGQLGGRKLPTVFRGKIDNVMKKKYQPHFAWGQLVSWFKQTIYDPSASLSAERRGTMSLPDPESAYSAKNYCTGDRKSMLNQLARDPSKMWPTTWAWSFRNPSKVYGSPFIDDAIRVAKGEERTVPALLEELRHVANKAEGGGLVAQKGGKKRKK